MGELRSLGRTADAGTCSRCCRARSRTGEHVLVFVSITSPSDGVVADLLGATWPSAYAARARGEAPIGSRSRCSTRITQRVAAEMLGDEEDPDSSSASSRLLAGEPSQGRSRRVAAAHRPAPAVLGRSMRRAMPLELDPELHRRSLAWPGARRHAVHGRPGRARRAAGPARRRGPTSPSAGRRRAPDERAGRPCRVFRQHLVLRVEPPAIRRSANCWPGPGPGLGAYAIRTSRSNS